MKQKIIDYIKRHPGCRKREIAGAIGVWVVDDKFRYTMAQLEIAGAIKSVVYRDPAQMEFYDKWYLLG